MTIRSSSTTTSDIIQYHEQYKTDHHAPSGFRNPWELPAELPGPLDAIGWVVSFPFKQKEIKPTEIVHLTRAQIISEKARHAAWWIGHATVLLRLSGKYVLTDPVFSDRVSPFSFAGPKREVPLPIRIEELPAVDVVVISHNHYDHLDVEAISELIRRFNPLFVVPLENAELLRARGATRILEMDWWQHAEGEGLRFHCLPARHFSNRGLTDRNRMLWASFLIEDGDFKTYFAGDTGYADHFKKIGEVFPRIDLALIPIGAYMPRWFMQEVHMDPEEAIQAYLDLSAREFLGIHWGTFVLTEEPLQEPKQRVAEIIQRRNLNQKRFHVLPIGGKLGLK